MLVHLSSHPRTDVARLPRSALTHLADGLRHAGVDVQHDAWVFPGVDIPSTVAACAEQFEREWSLQRPDLVHTFGVVATTAALDAAGGAVPVLATFDEQPVDEELERRLAGRVDAVLPLSSREAQRWRERGLPTVHPGVFPVPLAVPDERACAEPTGHVVTFADGPLLDALVAALPSWGATRLLIASRLSPARWAELRQLAERRGVRDRVVVRSGLRGAARSRMWSGAALLVAGPGGARHGGHVLEAASRGIPAVAVALDAHVDHVVSGSTGLLVDPGAFERALPRVVADLLDDPFALRALGSEALVRVATAHEPALAGHRLQSLYERVLADRGRDLTPTTAGSADPAVTGSTGARDVEERDRLAMQHVSLARQLAGWYRGRGQSPDDLEQVAMVGLLLAAERFDPSYGKEFHSFAVPTILGELRRHFRDHAWGLRVPRDLQETTLRVSRTADDLRQVLGREATTADLAAELGVDAEEVRAAQQVGEEARSVHSLDVLVTEDVPLAEAQGSADRGHELAELRADLREVLRHLPEREQQVLLLRFHGDLTQSQIAERLGISQVHVSRLLSRTLAVLREHFLADAELPQAWQPATATAAPARLAARAS